MIGGMPLLIKTCAQEIPFDTLEEGDIILHNDPYRGGLHCPEHTFFKPFFINGKLIGFAVSIGHVAEIGGMVPGGFCGEATEIFHEGLRVPPVKIRKRGEDVEEVWKLLLANVRTPRENYGDLRAMIAAVDLGERADRRDRRQVRRGRFTRDLRGPDGLFRAADAGRDRARSPTANTASRTCMENDGIEAKPYTVAVDLVHPGRRDRRRLSAQLANRRAAPINATLGVATGAVYNGMLHVTDPTIPKNSGCFRPIRVVSPPGRVTNVDYPFPLVAGNTETHPRLANIVIGAMAACAPERAMASESCTGTNFVFGGNHPDYDEYFACYDIMSGGWGGRLRRGRQRLRDRDQRQLPLQPDRGVRGPLPVPGRGMRHGHRFRRRRPMARRPRLHPHPARDLGHDHRQPVQRPPRGQALGPVRRRSRAAMAAR